MAGKEKKTGVSAGDNSIVIGGNVTGSNIVMGNNNKVSNSTTTVNISVMFDQIHQTLSSDQTIPLADKNEVQADLKEMQVELEKDEPDESFLARRYRNIKKMAPDIAAVALETLKNPLGGVAELITRVAKKVSEEAGAK